MTKPRVKPLEWDGWRGGITIAQSPLGRYSLGFDWRVIFPNGSMRRYKSEATAKAAAQADYEARILSALDLTPDPAVLVESQRELARWVAAESWRISGLVSNNDEAMRVHVEIGKMFGSLQSAENPAVLALARAAREAASALVGPCDTHEGCREALDALRKALAALEIAAPS